MPKLSAVRRLKVTSHYTRLHPSLKVASALRLSGDWLLHAGFRPGDMATIGVGEG